jgi:proline dehydrogenase
MIGRVVRRVGYARPVRRAVTTSAAFDGVRRRFVGGPDAASAVDVARRLESLGLHSTLHVRAGAPGDEEAVAEHVREYRALVSEAAARLRPGSEISLKMAQIGLHAPGGLDAAIERLRGLADDAGRAGVLVTMDIEGADEVEATLAAVRAVRSTHPEVGVAVQAYLLRTEADCAALAEEGARVRLVKGAYGAGPAIAHQGRPAIDAAFERCLRILMSGTGYPMVASHDDRLWAAARQEAVAAGRGVEDWEVQMLLGVRPGDQARLAAEGLRVRVYVPYGPDWYGWFVNRMAEKPSNVRLLAHSLVSR